MSCSWTPAWAGTAIPSSARARLTISSRSKAGIGAKFLRRRPVSPSTATARRRPCASWPPPRKIWCVSAIFCPSWRSAWARWSSRRARLRSTCAGASGCRASSAPCGSGRCKRWRKKRSQCAQQGGQLQQQLEQARQQRREVYARLEQLSARMQQLDVDMEGRRRALSQQERYQAIRKAVRRCWRRASATTSKTSSAPSRRGSRPEPGAAACQTS